jgi:hypothetical protein
VVLAEFYEFHDSSLEAMERRGESLVLRFKAYLHQQPDEQDETTWTGWVQIIEITLDKAVVEEAFVSFPVQIYDGCLKAASIDARPEDIVGSEIPASLRSASDVEIRVSGQGLDSEEYREMVVRSASAKITDKGEARFVENWIR